MLPGHMKGQMLVAGILFEVSGTAEDCLCATFGSRKPTPAFAVGWNWKGRMLRCCHTGKAAGLEAGSLMVGLLGRPRILHRECLHYALEWTEIPMSIILVVNRLDFFWALGLTSAGE